MKTLGLILLLVVSLQTCKAEYVWTGDEWKWSEPGEQINTDLSGKSVNKDVGEGSGGGNRPDDEDYDDSDYSYDANEDYDGYNNYNKPTKNNDNNDDEDMGEGSGGAEVEEPVFVHGSGGQYPVENVNHDYKPDDKNIEIDQFNNNGGQNINVDPYPNPRNPDDDLTIDEHNIEQPEDRNPTEKPVENQPPPTTKPEVTSTDGTPIKHKPRSTSFFAQPGILAAVIGGAVVGLLCAILLVMFIVYRMRKKDEGSYALDEPKRSPNVNSYSKPPSREFYA